MVRARPGMYLGSLGGEGALKLLLEVVGNAFDLHLAGRCQHVRVTVEADGTMEVSDDGPGLPVDGGDGLPPLAQLLTTLSTRPTVDGHRPHTHLGLHGLGLCVVNALSERFELRTVRGGRETSIAGGRGRVGAPMTRPSDAATGTTVRFRADPTALHDVQPPRAPLVTRLEELRDLAPGLALSWLIGGDPTPSVGLASYVARLLDARLVDVATARATLGPPAAPIDVEVAVSWHSGYMSASRGEADRRLIGFVNHRRTPHGTHLEGLRRGIERHGRGKPAPAQGLVAAVAVVLADVHWGNPTLNHVVTQAVIEPVEVTTLRALEAWDAAHPDQGRRLP